MEKSDLKGLWMPSEILINNKLSDKEKIILSMIMYLSKDKGYCFATNNYFSDILNITVVSISRIINSLKKKNYIKTNMNYKSNSKEIENSIDIFPIIWENILMEIPINFLLHHIYFSFLHLLTLLLCL